jgi:hypothetical protein
MENIEQEANAETTQKYIALLSKITDVEKRLSFTDIALLAINIFVLLFITNYISSGLIDKYYTAFPIELLLLFSCLVIGMASCTYWAATSIRLQLKLKLRYFQARFLERKMNRIGENIVSDESPFFSPSVRHLESPDHKENLRYPTDGLLRMDGFVGAAKPRHFSWFLPIIFFVIYCVVFIWLTFPLITQSFQ